MRQDKPKSVSSLNDFLRIEGEKWRRFEASSQPTQTVPTTAGQTADSKNMFIYRRNRLYATDSR